MNQGLYRYALADLSVKSHPAMRDTLGIEVTEPSIAALCGLGNIDPQHGLGLALTVPAAIEVCLDCPLPPAGAQLLTIRPDLDALGAMAVLLVRVNGLALPDELRDRVARIADADRFERGQWPGPRPLPRSVDEMLADGNGEALAVLAACAFDRALTLEARVTALAHWLLEGHLPRGYRTGLRRRANGLLLSLTMGATRVVTTDDGRIGTVVSMEPGALRLGYRLAPVVVALNPAFQFASGAAGRKYTLARWAEGDADLDQAVTRISQLESGWGGQRGIKGSPQGQPSKLSIEKVIEIVSFGLCSDANERALSA